MRYCSKCGNPLTDDQLFCPKCGNKEPFLEGQTPVINNQENPAQPTITPPKPRISTLKALKGVDKATYIFNYMMMFILLIYFVASVFLYINRSSVKEVNLPWINQIIAICVSALIFIETILIIVVYVIKYKKAENKKSNIVKSYMVLMILMIVGFCLSIGQIFLIPKFGVTVLDFITLFICADAYGVFEKTVKLEQK